MIVSEIVTRVKRQFGDESGVQVTDEDVIRWVNDAQRDIALHNNLLQTRATAAVTSGQSLYSLPPDILTIHSVRYRGAKLVGISMQEAEQTIPDTDDRGTPNKYWIWAKNITIYPIPDTTDPDDLYIFYTRTPVAITLLTSELELPVQYHNRIVEYCLQQAYELDENWAAAQAKGQQFTEGITRLKADEEHPIREFYPSITSLSEDY